MRGSSGKELTGIINRCRSFILLLVTLIFTLSTLAEAPKSESRLDFPESYNVTVEDWEYQLSFMGEAKREFFFFDIYDVAYYRSVHPPQSTTDNAGRAAQLLHIRYMRELPPQKVRDALRKGFLQNSSQEEWVKVNPTLEAFLSQIDRPVKRGDRLDIIWLNNGSVHFQLNNKSMKSYRDKLFMRILWSIWMGDEAVVNRKALLGKAVKR